VWIHGEDVTRLSPADRQVGYVPQDLALFPNLNVREHLEFALRLRRAGREAIAARTAELSAILSIGHLMERRVGGLSGGEAQRVALGRAISFRPHVLLLDEPLSALDSQTRVEMHRLLKELKLATGVTTLHVTHNEEEAEALADLRLRLVGGKIIATGKSG
jgi:ABC-type sugar transport system ATPase subunit